MGGGGRRVVNYQHIEDNEHYRAFKEEVTLYHILSCFDIRLIQYRSHRLRKIRMIVMNPYRQNPRIQHLLKASPPLVRWCNGTTAYCHGSMQARLLGSGAGMALQHSHSAQ